MDKNAYLEINASQKPAIDLLVSMGYTYISPADCEKQRGSRYHVLLKDVLRGQLATTYGDYEGIDKKLALLLSRCMLNVVSRPHFIAYRIGPKPFMVKLSEAMGAMKLGYTSHVEENEIGRDAVIFEFYRPRLKYK